MPISSFLLPCAAFLLLLILAGAALPFQLCLDLRRAESRRRSLYARSAVQLSGLLLGAQLLICLAAGADALAGGALDRLFSGIWRPLWLILAPAFALAFLFALPAKKRKSGALYVLSGVFAVVGACAASLLAAAVLGFAGAFPVAPDAAAVASPSFSSAGFTACASAAFSDLQASLGAVSPSRSGWLFLLFCFFLAPAAASGLGLCFHILRRRTDDFGRDYYSFVAGYRARQAAWAGLLLLLPAAALFWILFPPLPLGRIVFSAEKWLLPSATLCLPMAVACWHALGRVAAPMRHKSLAFLGVCFLWIGTFAFLGVLARFSMALGQ